VGQREVHQAHPEHDEDHPAPELGPVGDRAGQQRRGDHREHQLEHRERQQRYPVGLRPDQRRRVPKAEVVEAAEQPAPQVVAEDQREPERDPQHPDHGQAHDAHHHHVEHALGADQTAVEQRQPRRHQHHQRRTHEHPRRAPRIDHRFASRTSEAE
jgi:hypothetical protein